MTVDRALFFRLMGSFASGVTVVTSFGDDGVPRGFTASSFSSLSLDPPLCLVCIDRRSDSLPALESTRAFAVNVLADDQEELSRRFATKATDKFTGIAIERSPITGAPILDNVMAWVDCRLREMLEGGDHLILVGEIVNGDVREVDPLLYFRGQYRRLG